MNRTIDQVSVVELIQSLIDAWNRRDPTSFKSLFSEDANYISGDGRWFKGHSAIADLCSRGSESVSVVEGPLIEFYDALATAIFRWSVVENERNGGIITCVVHKQDTEWKI